MLKPVTMFLAPISLLLMAANSAPDPWAAWKRDLSRSCPSRDVELMGDGGYDEFLGAFYNTLTVSEKHRMDAVVDYRKACANETMGFGCEMSRNLYAAQKLGLLHRLVMFACRTVRCEEAASCSRFPRGSTY